MKSKRKRERERKIESTERKVGRHGDRRAGVEDGRRRERERERVETRTRGGVGACESCLLARRRHLLLLQSTLLSPSVLSPPPSLISLFSFLLKRVSYRVFPSPSSISLPSTLDSLTCRRKAEGSEKVRLVVQDYLHELSLSVHLVTRPTTSITLCALVIA